MADSLIKEEWNNIESTLISLLNDPTPITTPTHTTSPINDIYQGVCTLLMLGVDVERDIRRVVADFMRAEIEKKGLNEFSDVSGEKHMQLWAETYKKYRNFLLLSNHIGISSSSPPHHLTSPTSLPVSDLQVIFGRPHFFLNKPVNSLTKTCYKILFKVLKKNKKNLMKVFKKCFENHTEYPKNISFLVEFINILGDFGMKDKLLMKIEGDVVQVVFSEIEKNIPLLAHQPGISKEIIEVISNFTLPFPSKFRSRVKTDVLKRVIDTSNLQTFPINLKTNHGSITDMKYLHEIFSKAGRTDHLIKLYLTFIGTHPVITDGTPEMCELFNFHYKFLINKSIMEEFQNPVISTKVEEFYSFAVERIVDILVKCVDVLMKCAYSEDSMEADEREVISQIEICLKNNGNYLNFINREVLLESRRMKRVLVVDGNEKRLKTDEAGKGDIPLVDCVEMQESNSCITESKDSNSCVNNIQAGMLYTEPSGNIPNESIKLFRKAVFGILPQVIQLLKQPSNILEKLQKALSFRLLNRHFDERVENTLLSHLLPLHSEKMSRMLADAKCSDQVMLIRMCKWPSFKNSTVDLTECNNMELVTQLAAHKKATEKRLEKEGKKVKWFDGLSSLRVEMNGRVVEVTLFQYSVILRLCDGKRVTRPVGCLGYQFDLLVERGLVVEKDGAYGLNESSTETCFLPRFYELAGKDVSDNLAEEERDERSIGMAKIARMMKKAKRQSKEEIKEAVKTSMFDVCVQGLIEKGIIEVQGSDFVYIP